MSGSSKTTIKCNNIDDNNQLIKYYDDWAEDYDKDSTEERGYVGAEIGAKMLVQFLKQHQFGTDCRILDVGAGTGLVGEHLRHMNYTNVDALEPSEKSNDVARSKGLYKEFISEALEPGKQLTTPPDVYDAAICIGVFTLNNLNAEGPMDEMVRMVKPGGLICFSIREDVMFNKECGYEEKMAELVERNAWKLVSKSIEAYHLTGDKLKCYMFVYQVI